MIKTIGTDDLKLDMALYPRVDIDTAHIVRLQQAIEAGAKLPPIVACGKTRRVVDGFHRLYAYRNLNVAEILCDFRIYHDDAEFFRATVETNVGHGKPLDNYDLKKITLRLQRFGLDLGEVAQLVRVPADRLQDWMRESAVVERPAANSRVISSPRTPVNNSHSLSKPGIPVEKQKNIARGGGEQAIYHASRLNSLLEMEEFKISPELSLQLNKLTTLWLKKIGKKAEEFN